jgi:hypothetical protein
MKATSAGLIWGNSADGAWPALSALLFEMSQLSLGPGRRNHDDPGPTQSGYRQNMGRAKAGKERHGHRAGALDSVKGKEKFMAVRQHQHDSVARLHAGLLEVAAKLIDSLPQFGKGTRLAGEGEGGSLRGLPGSIGEHVDQGFDFGDRYC